MNRTPDFRLRAMCGRRGRTVGRNSPLRAYCAAPHAPATVGNAQLSSRVRHRRYTRVAPLFLHARARKGPNDQSMKSKATQCPTSRCTFTATQFLNVNCCGSTKVRTGSSPTVSLTRRRRSINTQLPPSRQWARAYPTTGPLTSATALEYPLLLPGEQTLPAVGAWRSLVAHLPGGQRVAGSNPVAPTK